MSYVYEFDCLLRVAAASPEEARERAQGIASSITDGPLDAQLSVEDDQPSIEDLEG